MNEKQLDKSKESKLLKIDPNILFSMINMAIRDFDGNLENYCKRNELDIDFVKKVLSDAGFIYNEEIKQFR
jgi:hypothetical protein